MKSKPGRRLKGMVRDVGRGGDAVVETELGLVFMPGGLPGERVELELLRSRGGVARGRLIGVLQPSSARRPASCPQVDRCGGCPLMVASAEAQRDIKRGFLKAACEGIAGAAACELAWFEAAQSQGYRRRARFAWHGQVLGYRRRDSARIIDIDDCAVLEPAVQQAWELARRWLGPHLRGTGEIALGLGPGKHAFAALRTDDEQVPALYAACEELAGLQSFCGVALRMGGASKAAVWGEPEMAFRSPDGFELRGPPDAFCQANDEVNVALVEYVVELAEPDDQRVLELFCGIGNFTIPLARRSATLVAVEQSASALAACRGNLRRAGLRAKLIEADANRAPKGQFDVLLLDPPRQGAKVLFSESLAFKPKRIVYVSCDTATLGRDLRLAQGQGYRIDALAGFDMFPQTAHLESVVRLVRQ